MPAGASSWNAAPLFTLGYEYRCLKKNLNASRPSEHPPVRGENVKTFRGGHRLQRQNLFMALFLTFSVCMYGHHIWQEKDQPGKIANPARGQLSRKN